MAQYEGGVTVVPEGVAYRAVEISRSSLLRTFGFSLISKLSTRIVISSIRGQFLAFAKIVEEVDKSNVNVSNIDYKYSSTRDADYRQEPVIVITQKEIE